jgi:hypothetical protein
MYTLMSQTVNSLAGSIVTSLPGVREADPVAPARRGCFHGSRPAAGLSVPLAGWFWIGEADPLEPACCLGRLVQGKRTRENAAILPTLQFCFCSTF